MLRDCPDKQSQRSSNSRAKSKTSVAQAGHLAQQGNLSSTGGGQLQDLLSHQDEEDSLDVVTGTLQDFNLNVYALLVPGATIYVVNPSI